MNKEKLSIRKRTSLWVLMLMLKIIEPTEYTHEYKEEIKKVQDLIKEL